MVLPSQVKMVHVPFKAFTRFVLISLALILFRIIFNYIIFNTFSPTVIRDTKFILYSFYRGENTISLLVTPGKN